MRLEENKINRRAHRGFAEGRREKIFLLCGSHFFLSGSQRLILFYKFLENELSSLFRSAKFTFFLLFFASSFNSFSQHDESAIANEFIVMLETGKDIAPILRSANLSSLISVKQHVSKSPNIWLLKTSGGNDDETLLLLKKIPGIIIAQKNHRTELRAVPNDTLYPQQWSMNNTG